MSFALLRKTLHTPEPPSDKTVCSVDLKTSSHKDLDKAIADIQTEIEHRRGVDMKKVALHLKHIEVELKENGPNPLSLEHLELYQSYLERLVLDGTSAPGIEGTVKKLLEQTLAMQSAHPQLGESRSKDTEDNRDGAAYLKVEYLQGMRNAHCVWPTRCRSSAGGR